MYESIIFNPDGSEADHSQYKASLSDATAWLLNNLLHDIQHKCNGCLIGGVYRRVDSSNTKCLAMYQVASNGVIYPVNFFQQPD
jgi:hypothetical protein